MPLMHPIRASIICIALLAAVGMIGCHGGAERDASSTVVTPSGPVVSQSGLLGDLNGNGIPDVADAIGILRIVVGLDAHNPLADCDGDGTVSVADAIMLLRCVVGLDDWPIGGGDPGLQPIDEMVGPDGQTLVWVPAGSFMMGSNSYSNEQPIHRVTLDGFWIGKHEVTNAQYQAFCNATGRTFPSGSNQGDDHPVAYVNWYDAQAYCDYYGYALPTEAQWEYAARGPAVPVYPWGDTWDLRKCCNWDNRGPGGRTHPVGSFPAGASWCGALDMAGNVREWCKDWYSSSYYQISPELNPRGPESGTYRVVRGGSCYDVDPRSLRAASRDIGVPSHRRDRGGFRCSRGL